MSKKLSKTVNRKIREILETFHSPVGLKEALWELDEIHSKQLNETVSALLQWLTRLIITHREKSGAEISKMLYDSDVYQSCVLGNEKELLKELKLKLSKRSSTKSTNPTQG